MLPETGKTWKLTKKLNPAAFNLTAIDTRYIQESLRSTKPNIKIYISTRYSRITRKYYVNAKG